MADYKITMNPQGGLLHIEFGKALHNHYAYSVWRVPADSDRTILLQDFNRKIPVAGEVVAIDTVPDSFDVRSNLIGQTILVAFFAARYDGEPDAAAFAIPLEISQPAGGAVLLNVDYLVASADLLKSTSFSIEVK